MSTDMTYDEYMSDSSEIGTLEHLLQGIPDERAVERIGLQSRLNRIRRRLEGVPVPPRPKKLSVSFDGRPVFGSYGVDANFGAEAVAIFSNTIRITTAGLTGELKATGQVPRSALSQPIITGVAFGSFGFEMEIPMPQDDPDGFSYPEEAINLVQELLRVTKEGADDDLSITTVALHPRAVNKVVELLDFMRKKEAHFATDYQGNEVRFNTDTEIENAVKRLAPSNTQIQTYEVVGTMIGVIPQTRLFQLNTNNADPIHGRIGPEIRNPYQIGEQHTNRQVRAQIRTVRIGRGAPRHTLVDVSEMPNLRDV